MAAVSYWILSPSFVLALLGKVRGWDRTVPTPLKDWRTAVVDVVVPARNEEGRIALALESLSRQDLTPRRITVVDDASTDRTVKVAQRFATLAGMDVEVIRQKEQGGKTPAIRTVCESSDADVLFVLDADTVLIHPDYIAKTVEELYRNAGVASVSGEVMPLRRRTIASAVARSETIATLRSEFGPSVGGETSLSTRLLTYLTIIYRTALYLFLHRIIYDGHSKLLGGTLNPAGCAVAYRRDRLADCFAYAKPRIGDYLSHSEDIYIGHFFIWKGYRNLHISVQCESTEPTVTRLWRQLFLWSSSFVQALHYFPSLPLSVLRIPANLRRGMSGAANKHQERRRTREQYRAPWSEQFTRRYGRPVGLLDTANLVEKITFPVILFALALLSPKYFFITIAAEAAASTLMVAAVADSGMRIRSAGMMVAATPLRLLSLVVDFVSLGSYLIDLTTGNRNWRK